jgi:hypothetical protein
LWKTACPSVYNLSIKSKHFFRATSGGCITRLTISVIAALVMVTVFRLVHLQAEELGKRSSFSIPLARLSVSFDERTHVFEKVKVSFDSDDDPADEYALIEPVSDYEIKNTRDGRQKAIHTEAPDKAFIISDFEAKILYKTCKSFVNTLEILEKDVQKLHWDRCLYLDAYFPRFLKGFYYLYCAARNSPYALPKSACIPDSLYDVSLTSPKSDGRIKSWQLKPDHIIKLRIIMKELIYQIKNWQKKELDNPNRNVEVPGGKKFEEAFTAFVKIYFNSGPLPELPKNGEHL